MTEREIFIAALERDDADERAALLDEACGGDPQLRDRVELLLRGHEKVGSFLDVPSDKGRATIDMPVISEGPGTVIERYKLLQQIGEGGFGVVFMAEQREPVRRNVALKVIKPGMDSRVVVARFEAERQALAMMDHPNIAHVLDGGVTESGRPYFVMELVKGVPITEYCDKNELPTEERLRLFVDVCRAVQHAHQKGVIHRDLKPSNIMVTLHDSQPVVKVIDFGVSKAVNQRLTERTLFTAYGQMIGTPQYMSPEQSEMSGLDVDTRSDVYSLGVLLYELLTGTTPVDAERLREAGYVEIQRIIQEEDPPKPSVRLSNAGEELTVIAKHRSVEPKRLRLLVRGELDWIVMKALEKDRNRRYDNASGFAADIIRFVEGEAVEACPPSRLYRLRKAVRRNRVAAISVAVISLAILITCATLGLLFSGAHRELALQTELGETRKEWTLESIRSLLLTNNPAKAKQLAERAATDFADGGFHDRYQQLRRQIQTSLRTPVLSMQTPISIAVSPDGKLVAIGTASQRLWMFSVLDGSIQRKFIRHGSWVRCVAFSPDGRTLASGSSDRTVRLWNVDTGETIHVLKRDHRIRSICFSPDGTTLAVGDKAGNVTLWAVDTGELLGHLEDHAKVQEDRTDKTEGDEEAKSIWHIRFSPDGSTIAASDYRTTTVWETDSRSHRFQIDRFAQGDWQPTEYSCAPTRHFEFSPSDGGSTLACWRLGESREVVLIDRMTGTKMCHLTESQDAHLAAFTPDGSALVASFPNGCVRLWEVKTGKLLRTLASSDNSPLYAVSYSPDGKILATGGGDNVVRLWNPESGEELDQLYGHYQRVGCLIFSPDGGVLVSRSDDGTARPWRLN